MRKKWLQNWCSVQFVLQPARIENPLAQNGDKSNGDKSSDTTRVSMSTRVKCQEQCECGSKQRRRTTRVVKKKSCVGGSGEKTSVTLAGRRIAREAPSAASLRGRVASPQALSMLARQVLSEESTELKSPASKRDSEHRKKEHVD